MILTFLARTSILAAMLINAFGFAAIVHAAYAQKPVPQSSRLFLLMFITTVLASIISTFGFGILKGRCVIVMIMMSSHYLFIIMLIEVIIDIAIFVLFAEIYILKRIVNSM